jgi:hypothetical protein
MAGGLLNIAATGSANVILTGQPTKTFFKVVYSKYTNFGLQKFRIDYDGLRTLRLTEESTFQFKIPRYADLLMDTYIAVRLPDIWSPIYHPCIKTGDNWAPYEFRWIRNLGANMIKEISITCGGMTLQKYSGAYLAAMVDRDFSTEKKRLFDEMTGNVPEVYDFANSHGRLNSYPSAYYINDTTSAEPSVRSRMIYVPINSWFGMDSRCAFPLIAVQYSQLQINVTLRPIQEMFQVRDVFDVENNYPMVQPDFNKEQFQMYRFLQSPPSVMLDMDRYENKTTIWNTDVHLMATYCFLTEEERRTFAMEDQVYLVKDIYEYQFENITGSGKVQLPSTGLVSSWMWQFQRNDVNMRNEWSNYTNWPYMSIVPQDIDLAPTTAVNVTDKDTGITRTLVGPLSQPDGVNTGIFTTGAFQPSNMREIMQTMGIVLGGEYRENTLDSGIYNYLEKYVRTKSFATPGLYCYNFCLNTDPFEYQPSGAMNMSRFNAIELEFTTITPTVDAVNSNFKILCDGNGNAIGVQKQNWRLFEYTFNLRVFEERYNVMSIVGGQCGMLYAR